MILISAIMLTAIATISFAQPGALDYDFNGGTVTTNISSITDGANSVALQPDGKIVLAGWSNNGTNEDFALARYNTDGTLDLSFSLDGKVTTAMGTGVDMATSVAIQTDGKIVAAGWNYDGVNVDFAMARYNTDGSLDLSFSTDGKVITAIGASDDYAHSVAIQPDGKIVVAGQSNTGVNYDFAVARYTSDGTLDPGFSADGKLTTAFGADLDVGRSVAIQADGKIAVAGYSYNGLNNDFAVARYNTNGSLDVTFSSNGKLTTAVGIANDYANSVAIQTDGKIVAAGQSDGLQPDFAVVRYNTDGTLDESFTEDGIVTTPIDGNWDIGLSVTLQPDGKIVVCGQSYTGSANLFAVIRYNTDGTPDSDFSGDGIVTNAIGIDAYGTAVAMQADGKIVVAGYSNNGSNHDFTVARYISGLVICNPCATPTNQQALNITQTSATLTWNAQPCAIGYKVVYRKQNAAAWTTVNINTNTSNTTLTPLTANTVYEWRVKTKCTGPVFSLGTGISTFITDFVRIAGQGTAATVKSLPKEIKIFPNPAISQIQIDVCDFEGSAQLSIFDLLGRNVSRMNLQLDGIKTPVIDVQDLPAGTYLVLIKTDSENRTGKFIKE